MCSTCNHKIYQKAVVQRGDKTEEVLQQSLGLGSLLICCDQDGKNYSLMVNGEPKSGYRLYSCPTCGKRLK